MPRWIVLGMLCLVGSLTGGCASLPVPESMPATLDGVPDRSSGLDARVFEARKVRDRGDPVAALNLVEEVLAESPRHVNGQRLRQDIMGSRGRSALLLNEALAWIDEHPTDPIGHYLHGRLLPQGPIQRAAFTRAVELDPRCFWGWLGLAWSLGAEQPDASFAIYEGLYARSQGSPLVAIALGRLLRRRDKPAALAMYEALSARGDDDGVGAQGLAETEPGNANYRRRALLARPFDPGVQRLHGTVALAGAGSVGKELLAILRAKPEVMAEFVKRDFGSHTVAQLFMREGQLDAAFEVLSNAPGGFGPKAKAPRRLWMRLLLARGEVSTYLAMLRRAMPLELLEDETNQVRGLWLRVFKTEFTEAHLQDPVAVHDFAEALLGVGLLEDAEGLLDRVLSRRAIAVSAAASSPSGAIDPGEPGPWDALVALRTSVRGEHAFQAQVATLLERGRRSEDPPPIEKVLDEIRQLSEDLLGRDVVGQPELFRVPFVGAMVDPLRSPLADHFARYNRHLELGQRAGEAVEWFVCVRLSVREVPAIVDLPLPARCVEIVGTARSGRTRGIAGGDVAGVALLNHYIVDMDAVNDWAESVIDRRRTIREDGVALGGDPLPALGTGGNQVPWRPGLLEGLDVDWRLAAASALKDSEVQGAVLDVIRKHERAHLVDSFHFLPIESHLLRAVGLAVSHGLSPFAVEGTMEGRAELAALATSPHTELVLAHIAEFLDAEEGSSPHALGFRQLARVLMQDLAAMGVPREGLRAAAWDKLDLVMVRELARKRLGGLW